MKKSGTLCLLLISCIFLSGLTGYFIGRNVGSTPIVITGADNIAQSSSATDSDAVENTASTAEPVTGKVNINTATLEELETLPGIGPVLAQRIIDYREANGPFETLSELTMVSGIGQAKLEALMDYATVGG